MNEEQAKFSRKPNLKSSRIVERVRKCCEYERLNLHSCEMSGFQEGTMEVEESSPDSKKVSQLVEMGFEEERAKIALGNCSGNVEQAMELLVSKDGESLEANNGAETSDAPKVAKSIRCVDTGKLFRNMNAAMIYAEKTGNTNFEECDIEIPPLTAEEKAQKVKELKERIKKKRAERAEQEKKEAIAREKQRRQGGQEMNAIREEHERLRREREYELRKKEKEDARIHREQLKRQLAEDKAERAADRAFKEGKDPKAAYQEAFDRAMGKVSGEASKKKAALSAEGQIDESIKSLLTYRAGGDGLKALGILKKLIKNPLSKPEEEKFRTVKLSNETIRKKVAVLKGGVAMLKAVGFKKNEAEEQLVLDDEHYNKELLQTAFDKIEQAIAANA